MVPRKRWMKSFETCPDCASTVRPFRGTEDKTGQYKRILFVCDCGASRAQITIKVDKP